MKSAQEYMESIRAMNIPVYAFGEKVPQVVDHPCFAPVLNSIALTYQLAKETGHETLMTAQSPFSGGPVNRFLHICQTPEDWARRSELGKFLTPLHGACVGARCAGTGALNALFAITWEMDQELGTEYHQHFIKFLTMAHKQDLTCSGTVTDAKGDRSKSPGAQTDPDVYLHIVERREDGIVISGAKAHQSGAALAHYMMVVPTTSLKESEKDFAVACAVPSNAPGVTHIAEAPSPNARRLIDNDPMDFGNYTFGVHGSTLVIFDKVFVPTERVFLCGEYEYAGKMAAVFGNMQRLASSACKAGHCDLACGAAAVAAEFNGCEKLTHIKDKLVQMSFQSTLAYGSSLASGYKASRHPSGAYLPDPMLANAAKLQAVEAVWECSKLAVEIAGGILCTAPTQKDFDNPDIGEYVRKYFKGRDDVSTENRVRITRLVEYLIGMGGAIPAETSQGAGPAAVQRLVMRLSFNLDYFKKCALKMAGIQT